MIKKKITTLLAATMIATQLSPIATYATENSNIDLKNNLDKEQETNTDLKQDEQNPTGEEVGGSKTEEDNKEVIEEENTVTEEGTSKGDTNTSEEIKVNPTIVSEPYKVTGSLELDMNFATPIKNTDSKFTNIQVTLKKENSTVATIDLGKDVENGVTDNGIKYKIEALNGKKKSLENSEDVSFYHINFESLELGDYTVEISGFGYAKAVIPNVEIQKSSKRIIFGTSDKTIMIDDKGTEDASDDIKEEYKGVFLSGDVNSDGKVDKTDYELMKAEIKKADKDLSFDLNKDQQVDITDLSYIHTNMDKTLGSAVIVDTNPIINPENAKIDVDTENVEVIGELKDILRNNGSTVVLQAKNNEQISEENPISIPIKLGQARNVENKIESLVIKSPAENAPSKGNIIIPNGNEDGTDLVIKFDESSYKKSLEKTADGKVMDEIVIDLGKQVAVSEITIKVTGGRGNKNLAEIASVEFVNNVYKETPKPKMSIPSIDNYTSATAVGAEFMQFKWNHQPNVTGYQLKVDKLDDKGKVTSSRIYKTSENFLRIEGGVSGYEVYRVSIQSLSGDEWSSGYKDEQEGYSSSKTGSTNFENNSNDKDGKPDNADKNYIPQGWNSITGTLTTIDDGQGGMYGADSIIELQLIPETKPEGPEGISSKSLHKGLNVSWKSHKKARDYDLYYRKVGEGAWTKANDPNDPKYVDNNVQNDIPDGVTDLNPDQKNDNDELIRNTSYIIKGLDDNQTYELKMTATNHHGTGGLSQTYLGKTENLVGPEMGKYKLINTPKSEFAEGESPVNGIVDISYPNWSQGDHPNGMEDKFAIVDGDYSTYWTSHTWNTSYTSSPKFTFDKEYEMDTIMIATRLDAGYGGNAYDYVPVRYFDSEKNEYVNINAKYTILNSNGKRYYKVTLPEAIKTKEMNVALRVHPSYEPLSSISEIKFYHYDSLEKDVDALFKDDLMLELAEGVTQEQIDSLRDRANTMDEASMEYHPNRDLILTDIERAQQILDDLNLDQNIKVLDVKINNSGNTIGQSNNWQSLGVAVKPGDKVNVYIGASNPNTKFELGITQHYAESGTAFKSYGMDLVPGKNEIVIPESGFQMDYEKGGNLFIKFKSNYKSNDVVKVRTSGATKIPHLNVNDLIGDESKEAETKALMREYIRELKTHVANVPSMYPNKGDKENNIYTYDPMTSVLNSTEIEGDSITLSLAADQVLNGITSGLSSEDEQVNRLYTNLRAWEQIMKVSYAQQGLIEQAIDFDGDGQITDKAQESLDGKSEKTYYNKNRIPQNRINIKYQRMFTGAFMYASGHHVGIGYGSVAGMMTGVPFKVNENGELIDKEDGSLFGWGIGHEIGHVHDIGGLTKAEVTNNILPLITQTFNDVNASRIEEGGYEAAYDKVTSGSIGGPTGGTALAMYWQLHLAYDDSYTYEMLKLNSDADLENDTIYSKVYRAAREKGVAANESGYNQFEQSWIMRASDAAGKDLRPFFLSWGIEASPKTNEYLNSKKYPVEEKKIQYLNDSARRKRLSAISSNNMGLIKMANDTKTIASFGENKDKIEIQNNSYLNQKNIPLKLSVSKDEEKILGYEIIRQESTTSGIKESVVGFVERDKDKDSTDGVTNYSDVLDAANNKVFTYKIKAYDYDLNMTEETVVGTVKVRHDGSLAKNSWSFDTNTVGVDEEITEDSGHGNSKSISNIADNDFNTVYKAKRATNNSGNAQKGDLYVTLDLGSARQITGLKYNPGVQPKKNLFKNIFGKKSEEYSAISNYEVLISADNKNWKKVHSGKFDATKENVIYFNEAGNSTNSQLIASNAQYVKLVAKGANTIAIAELDVIGQPGDNIEIGVTSDNQHYKNGLGRISSDYEYAPGKFIPKDSIIINGEYKGDPAFNIPLVINEDDENFALESQAILLAELPEDSELGEVAKGNWIYWITPEQQDKIINGEANIKGSKVKAELYRFNSLDANNKPQGQRMVSDTFYIDIPENLADLPEISLESSQAKSLNRVVVNIDSELMKSVVESRK